MNVNVYKVDGTVKSKIALPRVFNSGYKPRLILRAALASATARLQPKGVMHRAGRLNTAVYCGLRHHPNQLIGKRIARKPRLKNQRRLIQGNVAGIPGTVGGPRSHPPKVETVLKEYINKKEKRAALESALAALTDKTLVQERGHKFDSSVSLPIIVENKLEAVEKTKDIIDFMKKIGVYADVERAKSSKNIRAGRGKSRGRKYKTAKSVIFITNDEKSKLYLSARNIEGVDVVAAKNLCVENIAPAGKSSRLAIFVEDALKKVE